MSDTVSNIAASLAAVRARIEAAAARAGRDPREVTLVAISKTNPAEAVREAMAAGQLVFGENRIQEALPKIEAVGGAARWHLVGHLQSNKARQAVGRFELIHSVDSVGLIHELNERAAAAGLVQKILLQINVSGEASKFGAPPEALGELLGAVACAPHLAAEGLMTIPPFTDDPETSRPHFIRLRGLLDAIPANAPLTARHLSMGMSDDFEVAIEEGATLVRVGTAIFGARNYQ
ncbi:MAG: YggS family pyridoxal phosphate-dependent enzyme [Candidatus Sumerlaeia bacterium]